MDKKILIKYINNSLSPLERDKVESWILSKEENLKYFTQLKDLWLRENAPQTPASDNELKEISHILQQKQKTSLRKRTSIKIIWTSVAAIFIVGLFLNIVIFRNYLNTNNKQISTTTLSPIKSFNKNSTSVRTLYTDKGVKAKIILPDSSEVWLNSDSKLEYPQEFAEDYREVFLSGEAYFKVVKDSNCPMVVKTNKGFYIKVLGTEFNLKCYENDTKSKTVLYSGKIDLITQDNTYEKTIIKLKPNESYILEESKTLIKGNVIKNKLNTSDSLWKEGILIFEDDQMADVIKKLERWHGANFIIKDPQIYSNKLTANFKGESLVQIMELISLCTNISYKIDGANVYLATRR